MITLINSPFASTLHPSIGIGLIKSILIDTFPETKVLNLNMDLGMVMGFQIYETMCLQRGFDAQIGEWLFSKEAWGDFGPSPDQFLKDYCPRWSALPDIKNATEWLINFRNNEIPIFLDNSVKKIIDTGNPIVAFSSTFFQTLPVLALAKRLKEVAPDKTIICGGSCFHGEMGLELISSFKYIDIISIGEADGVILKLIQTIVKGKKPVNLPGIYFRDMDNKIVGTPPSITDEETFNMTPTPDYTDYFTALEEKGINSVNGFKTRNFLPFESSRGCSKGEHQHCAFCGLNNEGLVYRKKLIKNINRDIDEFIKKYPSKRFHATDNIVPQELFKNFFPQISERLKDNPVEFFFEVRSTLTREQVEILAKAKVRYIQPGIESLSTGMLKAMNKGVTAIRNIYFLKLCRSFGIYPLWNLMYNVPGESEEDYKIMNKTIPKIIHLFPPHGGARPIEIQRFSPYFSEGEKWAKNIKPRDWYKGLYPEEKININKVAYFFDGDWNNTVDKNNYKKFIEKVILWMEIWRTSEILPTMIMNYINDEEIIINDTRRIGQTGTWKLNKLESIVYSTMEEPVTINKILKKVSDYEKEEVHNIISNFLKFNLIIEENGRYLALALPHGYPEFPYSFRHQQTRAAVKYDSLMI